MDKYQPRMQTARRSECHSSLATVRQWVCVVVSHEACGSLSLQLKDTCVPVSTKPEGICIHEDIFSVLGDPRFL